MVTRALLLFGLAAGAFAAESSSEETLRGALNAYDDAVALDRRDAAGAAELYRAAADGFERLLADGFAGAALHYNLGNVHFRLGEIGQAIAHYRRAQRYEPGDRLIAANLAYARQRVEPAIEAGDNRELLQRLLFWQYGTSRRTRLWIAGVAGVFGWLGLAAWLRWRAKPLLVAAVVGIVLGLSNSALLAWELRGDDRSPAGVVVGDAWVLRLGRGDGHDAALSEPLGPGVELTLLQQRGDWYEVTLANGTRGWLPAAAVERV